MSEQFESQLKEMFEKIKPKVIFKSTDYLSILKISFDLIEKLHKKNKEYRKLSTEEKEKIARNISIYITQISREHNIINQDTEKIILGFINHKDSIFNFIELIYNKGCFCFKKKKHKFI
tara:strand:+ start:15 stop:371 length:357 start_codon:yes stop_codon:yes gene_type:complete